MLIDVQSRWITGKWWKATSQNRMMHALRYCFEEAFVSLWRGRRSGIFSIATIAAAQFVLGVFLLLTANAERVLADWSRAAEISVYLRDDVSADQRRAVERELGDSGIVISREYVSKSDAFSRFKRDFADLAMVVDGFNENPLPASYEVRVRSDLADRDAVAALAAGLAKQKGVADVRFDRRWLDRLLTVVAFVRGLGLVLVAVLVLAAALTVTNVVRLACHTRRDEIEIMELVGAPMFYIRGPFIVEGVLQGGVGAAVSLLLLWVCYLGTGIWFGSVTSEVLGSSAITFLPVDQCVWLVAGGMLVGCLGAAIGAGTQRQTQAAETDA